MEVYMAKKIKLKKSRSIFKKNILNRKHKNKIKLKTSNLFKSRKPLNKKKKVKRVNHKDDLIAINKKNSASNNKNRYILSTKVR